MAVRTRTDGLEELRAKIVESLRGIGYPDVHIDVGWLGRDPEDAEVLVEVTLSDPGEERTWNREMTSAIRTVVRTATSEVMPWAVATTRLVSAEDDA